MQRPQKTLYIIRHGETDPNKNHIIQGSGLDAPLNQTGRLQASDFYHAYRHIDFQTIYTSALLRTWQSVSKFIEAGVRHVPLADLNEISWGVKDGTRIDPEEQIIYLSLLKDWSAGLLDRSFLNGESPNQVANRLSRAIELILKKEDETICLVCIHGRALRILLCLLLKIPLTRMEEFLHSNLCLYILHWDGYGWSVELSNDVTHLRE